MSICQRVVQALLLLVAALPSVLRADWPCRSDSSVPVVVQPGNQWNVRVASDRKNGAYLAWQDRRGSAVDKLYIQRVSAAGITLWAPGGVPVAVTPGYQYYPQLASDDVGNLYIVWQDNRNAIDYDIYIQKVSPNGTPLWTTNGVSASSAVGHQYFPQVCIDGKGGVIVVWQDKREGNFDIYAQRFDGNGNAQWQQHGISISKSNGDQVEPKLVPDEMGGALVVWTDYRSGSGFSDVFAQRVISNGVLAWGAGGLPVCQAGNTQWNLQFIQDGSGGGIVAWQDRRVGAYDNIYAQRFDVNGQMKWAADGVAAAPVSGIQYYPQLAGDGQGGAVIGWQDNRLGADYDIYCQRISKTGQVLWGSGGAPVCLATGHQYNPQIVSQNGTALITWQDRRQPDFNIYAQCMELDGRADWTTNGIPITTASQDQFMPQMVSDGVQGAIIAWSDYHASGTSTDVFAHRLGANGKLAGGCYRSFGQDDFALKSNRIRRNQFEANMPNAGNVRDSVFGRGAFAQGVVLGVERLDSAKRYGWTYYTRKFYVKRALPQAGEPRPFDRILDRPFVGYLKNPSTYRYNNELSGELLTLKLNIAASDAGITEHYLGELIYRDTVQSNPLNGKTLRGIVASVDSMMTYWKRYSVNYRQISNSLKQINATFTGVFDTLSTSPLKVRPAKAVFSVSHLVPNAAPPPAIPVFHPMADDDEFAQTFRLMQNYPNPFNPVTTIEFELPEAAEVSLKVFNILGQQVAALLDRSSLDEGRQIVDFDASRLSSGVYFYQVIAEPVAAHGSFHSQIKKMLLVK